MKILHLCNSEYQHLEGCVQENNADMGRIPKIGSFHLQLFTNLISIFNVYTKLVIQLQKWNATVLLRKSGSFSFAYAADDKLDKVLWKQLQVIKILSG